VATPREAKAVVPLTLPNRLVRSQGRPLRVVVVVLVDRESGRVVGPDGGTGDVPAVVRAGVRIVVVPVTQVRVHDERNQLGNAAVHSQPLAVGQRDRGEGTTARCSPTLLRGVSAV